jgi:hypothetical protein
MFFRLQLKSASNTITSLLIVFYCCFRKCWRGGNFHELIDFLCASDPYSILDMTLRTINQIAQIQFSHNQLLILHRSTSSDPQKSKIWISTPQRAQSQTPRQQQQQHPPDLL